ncbi:mucin-2 [Drosophila obscura]|uniref:mucin-2 n=1 Tax=Drosophila obscura TaxID=7282 RepID=UPI001BB14872|nr:mucin-2 [Drosophila obscura]
MLTTSHRWMWCWMFVLAIYGSAHNYALGYYQTADAVDCPPGYQNVNGYCYSSLYCPAGYYLGTDGQCYAHNALVCPTGYYLSTDGKCYLKDPLPCPFESTTATAPVTTPQPTPVTTQPTTTTTTTTTTERTTTTTTTTTEPPPPPPPPEVPPPVELARCPPGSIFYEEQCRRIVCSEGEYYAGRCLSPACPPGTVWHGRSCQEPGYITTILEIDNVIRNQHEYTLATENINRVEYATLRPYDEAYDKSYEATTTRHEEANDVPTTTKRPWMYPSGRTTPTTLRPATPDVFPGRNPPPGCCVVKSPRICINYAPNWVCSSRERKLCDPRVCTHPVIYLKPPQIVESENRRRLVMPPNPPLQACSTPECKESEFLDCSGCKHNQRDKCSAGCYSYYCPNGSCAFMNSQDYCGIYPSGFGCNVDDGCIWDWCHKKCY